MSSVPAAKKPDVSSESPAALVVTVLFTDVPHTLAALHYAGVLGSSLHASLRILMPVVVPYPLDISASPVDSRYMCRRLVTIADGMRIPTRIEIVHCRHRAQAIETALDPHSILVLCWRRRWQPFDRTARLARKLKQLGHQVMDVRSE